MVGKIATDLAVGLGKDPAYAMLHATPFLELFGHVATAHYLLDGACVAQEAFDAIAEREGATDDAARTKLVADNDEAAFYHARVASARYFIASILPHAHAMAEAAEAMDRSALDIRFFEES